MEVDYQKMFNNFAVLLQDICDFLCNDKLKFLSHRDRKIVESLVNRSKVQLQEITNVEQTLTQEYVDMDAKKVSEEEEEKLEIYSSVDDVNTTSNNILQPLCPYLDLPAKDASQNVKSGFMSMRRKFILGFEKMKRVYGSIHKQWLIIYNTNKDMKPIHTFDLKHYEAKESDGPKSTCFELMSILSDRKIYYFMAVTPKDALQWVAHINRCHDKVIVQSKGLDLGDNNLHNNEPFIEEDIEQDYDFIKPSSDHNEQAEDEDDIYLELDSITKPQNKNTVPQKNEKEESSFFPPLPVRPPQRLSPLPMPPPLAKSPSPFHESDESLASYHDINELRQTPDLSTDTFSDEDEQIYEAFVSVKPKIITKSYPLPTENTDEANESKNQFTANVTEREITEPKNEPLIIIRDKIEKRHLKSSSTTEKNASIDADKKDAFSRKRNRSFIHEGAKKMNNLLNLPPDAAINDADDNAKNEIPPPIDDNARNKIPPPISPKEKVPRKLIPPVIAKVPVVPVKPKITDRPSIGKRSPFHNFRQTNGD